MRRRCCWRGGPGRPAAGQGGRAIGLGGQAAQGAQNEAGEGRGSPHAAGLTCAYCGSVGALCSSRLCRLPRTWGCCCRGCRTPWGRGLGAIPLPAGRVSGPQRYAGAAGSCGGWMVYGTPCSADLPAVAPVCCCPLLPRQTRAGAAGVCMCSTGPCNALCTLSMLLPNTGRRQQDSLHQRGLPAAPPRWLFAMAMPRSAAPPNRSSYCPGRPSEPRAGQHVADCHCGAPAGSRPVRGCQGPQGHQQGGAPGTGCGAGVWAAIAAV